MARKVDEIKSEYTNVALKAGSLQYEILTKQDDLNLVNNRMKDLNLEYIQASNLEAEVAKKVAEEQAKAPAEQPKQETQNG